MEQLEDLQNLIRGSLFLNAAMDQYSDDGHPHVSLARQVASSILYGTLNKYENLHGKEALDQFLESIPELIIEGDNGDEDRGESAAPNL